MLKENCNNPIYFPKKVFGQLQIARSLQRSANHFIGRSLKIWGGKKVTSNENLAENFLIRFQGRESWKAEERKQGSRNNRFLHPTVSDLGSKKLGSNSTDFENWKIREEQEVCPNWSLRWMRRRILVLLFEILFAYSNFTNEAQLKAIFRLLPICIDGRGMQIIGLRSTRLWNASSRGLVRAFFPPSLHAPDFGICSWNWVDGKEGIILRIIPLPLFDLFQFLQLGICCFCWEPAQRS